MEAHLGFEDAPSALRGLLDKLPDREAIYAPLKRGVGANCSLGLVEIRRSIIH